MTLSPIFWALLLGQTIKLYNLAWYVDGVVCCGRFEGQSRNLPYSFMTPPPPILPLTCLSAFAHLVPWSSISRHTTFNIDSLQSGVGSVDTG